MKIRVVSDIHTEFHADDGKAFIENMPNDVDVLIICGDLSTTQQFSYSKTTLLESAAYFLSKRFKNIVYVAGNHEYYHSSKTKTHSILRDINNKYENFHWLNNDFIKIEGQRFIGAPLWFERFPDNHLYSFNMADFQAIKDFESFVYTENFNTKAYFESFVQEDDIIITHHMPSNQLIHPFFKNSSLNRFFVCDMEYIILGKEPKLWCCGHTHFSFDTTLGNTRIVCNPFGYVGSENKDFDENLSIEV